MRRWRVGTLGIAARRALLHAHAIRLLSGYGVAMSNAEQGSLGQVSASGYERPREHGPRSRLVLDAAGSRRVGTRLRGHEILPTMMRWRLTLADVPAVLLVLLCALSLGARALLLLGR